MPRASHHFTPEELQWYKAARNLLSHIQRQGIKTLDFRPYQIYAGGGFDGPQWKESAIKQFGFPAAHPRNSGKWAIYAEMVGLTGQPLGTSVTVLNPPEDYA